MIAFQDTRPETPRLLWLLRHVPILTCPTCGHAYWPGHFRDHLRSVAHRDNRGWWR